MRKVFSLLLALALVFSLTIPAFAASDVPTSGTFTVLGAEKEKVNGETVYTVNYTARPGSNYHVTDLFNGEFKNVMPGDVIEADIVLTADFSLFNEDSIKFWLYSIPHDETSNPLQYYESAEQGEGKDDNDSIDNAGRDETVASMNDFLSKLKLTITNLSSKKVIYSGPANGDFLTEDPIATIRAKGSVTLRVKLEVPIELNNTYALRVGEIDWGIKISAYDDPVIDNPKTGDYIMMAVSVMAISAAALVILLVIKRKKKQ